MKNIFLVISSALLLLQACNTLKPSANHTSSNLKSKEAKKKYPYRASYTRYFDLLHTKLELVPDWKKQQLNGLATLKLKPFFYPQNKLVIDAKGMDLHEIKFQGKEIQKESYTYDQKQISIFLPKSFTATDTLLLEIKYTAKPNELPKGGSEAITEDKGLYFINPLGDDPYKPQQLWTQGETESSSCWFPTIEATNERCTQEMYITADTGFTILSNGEFVYSKQNKGGTRTEYWKMDLPHAPYLFMMAIGKYAVVEDKMPSKSKFAWDDFEVKYYVEPAFKPYAKAIFGNTPEMIDFFSTKLGVKFPWNKYSQIVVRDFVSGAMENTTASVFMEALQVDNRSLLDKNWDYIIAHELFHQWFGDLITCESWANLPLNESFANYSEYLWAEYKFGKEAAYLHAENETKEYLEESRYKNVPLIRYHFSDKEDMFDRHSYNKGGRVLHMLRMLVGDEAFFKSLNLYLTSNQYKAVEIHHLRLAFEEVTGKDLNWFFNQWFFKEGHPKLTIKHSYKDGNLNIEIAQIQDTLQSAVYQLPVQIAVWEGGIQKIFSIEITQAKQKVSIPLLNKPSLVLFDFQNQLLAEINHEKSDEEWMFQFQYATEYPAKIAALRKLFDRKPIIKDGQTISIFSNPVFNKILKQSLNDSSEAVRAYALEQFSAQFIPNMEEFIKDLVKIADQDTKPKNQAYAIGLLASLGGNAFDELFLQKLDAKPYSVAGAALEALISKDNPKAKEKIKTFQNAEDINIVLAVGKIYVKEKDATQFEWFRKQLDTGDAQKQYNLLFIFDKYLDILPADNKAAAKVLLLKIMNQTPHKVIKEKAQACAAKLN
jgi:aminopeptidase N